MKIHFSPIKYVWTLFILIPLVSCQTIGVKNSGTYGNLPHVKDEAVRLFSDIKNTNKNLKTFKGIGNLKLINKNKSTKLRAAWMGTHYGNFRVEIFGIPGQSAARYSNDGQYSYVYLPLEDRFYIIDAGNPSLEKILTLPITSKDLSAFLSGRIPIYNYGTDQTKIEVSDDGYKLSLKKGCFGDRKIIFIDKNNKTIYKVEVFNLFGSLKYRTELNKIQSINGYSIPFEIIISDNDDNRLYIHIDKYWTNTPIPLSSFTLTHPN